MVIYYINDQNFSLQKLLHKIQTHILYLLHTEVEVELRL